MREKSEPDSRPAPEGGVGDSQNGGVVKLRKKRKNKKKKNKTKNKAREG